MTEINNNNKNFFKPLTTFVMLQPCASRIFHFKTLNGMEKLKKKKEIVVRKGKKKIIFMLIKCLFYGNHAIEPENLMTKSSLC